GSERMAQRPLPSWLSELTSSDPLTRVTPRLPSWPAGRPRSPTPRPARPGRQTLRIAEVRGTYVSQLGAEFRWDGRKGTPLFRTPFSSPPVDDRVLAGPNYTQGQWPARWVRLFSFGLTVFVQ